MRVTEELDGVNETMLDALGVEALEETDEVDVACVAAGPVPTAFTAATDTVYFELLVRPVIVHEPPDDGAGSTIERQGTVGPLAGVAETT
jgi:hypothetical protein